MPLLRPNVGKGDYLAALTGIATLKGAVDAFFDKVMVMAEDERLKTNRLALLTRYFQTFQQYCGFFPEFQSDST